MKTMQTDMGVDPRPLVLHVVYRFDTGGLENGIVNLINHMPEHAYRHAVLALTEVSPAFSERIRRSDVSLHALHKSPGHGLWQYARLYQTFRRLRPSIVHTRNLAALECQVPAWAARVPARVHGEHGRDVADPDGGNRRHQWARRLYRPFVQHQLALSRDLADYLIRKVGVPAASLTQVYNGVDSQVFRPTPDGRRGPIEGSPFNDPSLWLAGTVGRMQTIKDQTMLAHAFVRALELQPALGARLRLVMVGDGPLRNECTRILAAAGISDLAWLPGERADVPDVMRGLDCFVLPSIAEGISNTILEAMASGLPVLATSVGGNADLVLADKTGQLVPAADVEAMAAALVHAVQSPESSGAQGRAGREAAERHFSLHAMVATYQGIYDRLLQDAGRSKQGH